jgi:hypothetical protein
MTRPRAEAPRRRRKNGPRHLTADGAADIKTELIDSTEIHLTGSWFRRREHTAHLLLRSDDKAEAGRYIARSMPALTRSGATIGCSLRDAGANVNPPIATIDNAAAAIALTDFFMTIPPLMN